jgi:hypothetical protein
MDPDTRPGSIRSASPARERYPARARVRSSSHLVTDQDPGQGRCRETGEVAADPENGS